MTNAVFCLARNRRELKRLSEPRSGGHPEESEVGGRCEATAAVSVAFDFHGLFGVGNRKAGRTTSESDSGA